METVSVIIPAHNYGRFISGAIESALHQSHHCEVIVVDDGSTDCTASVATRYPVRYVFQRHIGNTTPARAMYTGIRLAKGDYIVCLGADDKLATSYVEKCLSVFHGDPNLSFVWTGTCEFGRDHRIRLPQRIGTHKLCMYRNPGGQLGAMMIRRRVFDDVGFYDRNLHGLEDWDLAIRMCLHGLKGRSISEVLHYTRLHEANMRDKRLIWELYQKYPLMKFYELASRFSCWLHRPIQALFRIRFRVCGVQCPPDRSQHVWVDEKHVLRRVRGAKVLDAGCGIGRWGFLMKHREVIGVDVWKPYLIRAKCAGYAGLVQADLASLPFRTERVFDTVLAVEVIEHLSKTAGNMFLKQARRLTGFLVLTTPRDFVPVNFGKGHPENHLSHWTRSEVMQILKFNSEARFQFALNETEYERELSVTV